MVKAAPAAPITNRLLDLLPARQLASLLAHCEKVQLTVADVIGDPGRRLRHVFFPLDGFISLMTPTAGREAIQVGLAGNEGMYGVGAALGGVFYRVHASVQGSGSAWRIGVDEFRRELARSPALLKGVHGYIYVLLSQLVQTAECNRFHVVEQRLARWLLMTSDRAHSPAFRLTHEVIAHQLGVRRVGVTKAASALQRRKLIAYSRGAITILDRSGLEHASCPCYRIDLATYDRVFG